MGYIDLPLRSYVAGVGGISSAFPGTNPNTLTVLNPNVTASSVILLTIQNYTGPHASAVWVRSITPGVGFVIESKDVNFVGTVGYLIVQP